MRYPEKETIVALHDDLVGIFGGEPGLFNPDALDAAHAAPLQGFGDVDLYPSVEEKAARLGFGLVSNHAFFDGNKRIGAHMMLHVLAMNGRQVADDAEGLFDLIMGVAQGRLGYDAMLDWLRTWLR